MVIRTEIFCQVIPEKNQAENANTLKKSKKHQILCMFTNLYPFLIRLCRPQEVIPKLMKHILSNVPHLLSPQQALEVSQTHILGAISCYFATGIMKDPVFIYLLKQTFRLKPCILHFTTSILTFNVRSESVYRAVNMEKVHLAKS